MAKSFLRTALNNLVEARQRRADLYATGALLSLDDASLTTMGLSRDELRRARISGRSSDQRRSARSSRIASA